MALEIGQRVGEYEILSLLGAGGMGQVYGVRNVISGRVEAMKVLLQDLAAESELASRFTVEIRTLAALEHPNIAQLRTAFQFENQLVMIMEFVEGTTLEKLVGARPILVHDALSYSSQVLAALSFAHSKRVIHRDIKPANVMVTSHGVVKLMDFGIAKSGNDTNLTRTGMTVGSLYYMSPEQVRGDMADARSDIYSFGVTLYQMLTGRKPFQGENTYNVLNAQLNESPVPPDQLNPTLPPGLSEVVLRAMAKAPQDRYQSAEEFREAVSRVEKGLESTASVAAIPVPIPAPIQGTVPPIPPPLPPAPIPQKSQRALWLGLGAVAAIIAMIAAITFLPRMLATHASQKADASITQPQASTPSPGGANIAAPPKPAVVTPTPAPDTQPVMKADATPSQLNPLQPSAPPEGVSTSRARPASAPAPAAPAAPPADAQPSAPSRQEMNQARTRMVQLDSRAEAARSSIEQLRAQQQAQGLGLRGDIASSLNRMNAYINESNRALNEGDLQSADANMDRAEKELSTLETFLGR